MVKEIPLMEELLHSRSMNKFYYPLRTGRDMDAYKKTIHLHLKLIRQLLQ